MLGSSHNGAFWNLLRCATVTLKDKSKKLIVSDIITSVPVSKHKGKGTVIEEYGFKLGKLFQPNNVDPESFSG